MEKNPNYSGRNQQKLGQKKSRRKKQKRWPLRLIVTLLVFQLVILATTLVFRLKFPLASEQLMDKIGDQLAGQTGQIKPEQEPVLPEKSPVLDNSQSQTLPFTLNADSVFLFDLDKDEIVYAKNPEKSRAPASLTKIMTAVIALEETPDLDSKILIFHQEMQDELLGYGLPLADIATFDLVEGEKITMRQALYLLMLRSSNDVANLIASELGGGSIPDFVEKMNRRAGELGATNSNFTNPHGLDDPAMVTTAYDLFLLTRHAMNLPGFMDIATTYLYQLPSTNKRQAVGVETYLYMQDARFPDGPYYYAYLKGIKTGYTEEAGKCLISSAEKDGRRFLMVLMGVPAQNTSGETLGYYQFFLETRSLYQWVYARKEP